MKMKCFKRVLALALGAAMVLTACGQQPASNTSESIKPSESATVKESEAPSESVDPEDLPTITLYPKDANLFSGLVTGYRGDFLAEHGFNLEVWSFSSEKTTAMLTSGDFPDMMYVGAGGMDTLTTLIETDKIINYDDYQEYLPNIFGDDIPNEYITPNLQVARDDFSAGTGGLYVLPHGVGVTSGLYSKAGTFDRNVPKLKWDVYEAIGTPEITDMWGLLDIAEEMLEYQDTAEDGTAMYGMFLDNGMDTNYWGGMYLWFAWHGYQSNAQYFVENSQVTGEQKVIFDDDSVYKEGAKWYNEAYLRGLMDPDSISTARTDQAPKLDNGYAMLPAGTLPGWASKYYEVFPSDVVVYRDFITDKMTSVNNSIVVFKDSENIEACLKFINMMADPFEWMQLYYGPEGAIWQLDGNVVSITDEFAAWLKEKGSINFFPMPDGTEYSIFNTTSLIGTGTTLPGFVNVEGKPVTYIPTSWPDAQAITGNNTNWEAWKETMGVDSLWEYCEQHGIEVCQESVFEGVAVPKPDDAMTLTWASVKDVVVNGTWNCAYAESDEEFEQIWDKMVEDAYSLGAQEVIDWYLENYKPIR